MITAEQLLNISQRQVRGIRNTLQGVRKYTIVKEFSENYVVLDLDTTGLRPGADRIIQIGAIKYKNNKQVEEFRTLINPKRFIPIEATRKTKITNFLVEDAPVIEHKIEELFSFIDDLPVVTYNATLHMKFLYAIEQLNDIQLPTLTIIDTTRLAQKALATISYDNLQELTACLQQIHDKEDIMHSCRANRKVYQLCSREL